MKVCQILEARTMADDRPDWIRDERAVADFVKKWKVAIRDELWHRWMVARDYDGADEDALENFVEVMHDNPPVQILAIKKTVPHESLNSDFDSAYEQVVDDFHHEAHDDLNDNSEW